MSVALSEEETRAAEARHRAQRVGIERTLDELRRQGVREGSVAYIETALRSQRDVAGSALFDAVLGVPVGEFEPGKTYDPVLEAYAPDRNSDLHAALVCELASTRPPTLDVHCPAYDGRPEIVQFGAREAKAYLGSDWAQQASLRTSAIRERRLRTAIGAATRLREAQGRRPEITVETSLTVDEQLCLIEFGGVEVSQRRDVDADGRRFVRDALTLREGWSTLARRALSAKTADLEPAALRESFGSPSPQRLREWWGFDRDVIGGLSGIDGSPAGDFALSSRHSLQTGPQTVQMRLNDVWDEQRKSRLAYQTDPICKQGIRVASNFVLGRGFSVAATDQDFVQRVLDEYDARHTAAEKKRWLRAALVLGEIFLWRQKIGGGLVAHTVLPAETIWYVVTEGGDSSKLLFYVQRYTTPFQPAAGPDNPSHYVDRLIPAAEVRHFKINAELDEVRGRGEPYAALAWHLKFRNHWEAQIEKDYSSAAYAYKAIVEGDAGQIRKFIATSVPKRRPAPGSWHVFNSKVKEFDVIKADTTQPSGQGSTSNGILNVLAANYGFAKEYFGVDGNRTRGGQVISAGPAEKSFEDRQDDFGEFIATVYQDAIDEARAFALIPETAADGKPLDVTFTVNFPDIIKGDSLQKVQLIVVGRAQGFISHQTGAQLWASAIDIGATYDYQAELERIKTEAAAGISLPELPPHFDTIDGTNGSAGNAAGNDPRSASGAAAARQTDSGAKETLADFDRDELAAEINERGGIVYLP